jgi:hypothetical protein
MPYQIVLTDAQENGLAVKLQEENARRLRPVVIAGRPTKLPQITAEQYVQAVIEDIAAQGVKQLKELEDSQLFEQFKSAMSDPLKSQAIDRIIK